MDPVEITLEMTLPDRDPKNPEDRIATFAGPPRAWPSSAPARSMKNRPPPETVRATPNKMNPISRSAMTRSGMPMMLSTPSEWLSMVSLNDIWAPQRKPGRWPV